MKDGAMSEQSEEAEVGTDEANQPDKPDEDPVQETPGCFDQGCTGLMIAMPLAAGTLFGSLVWFITATSPLWKVIYGFLAFVAAIGILLMRLLTDDGSNKWFDIAVTSFLLIVITLVVYLPLLLR